MDFAKHTLHWLALLLYTGSLTNFVKIHELKSCHLFLKCLCLENFSLWFVGNKVVDLVGHVQP